ncbi:MAG: HD domain-containing phosphohydrolase [Pseudomonadales bacterium]|jgi:HD-GYP domain-containing protein (c-di-GMP phosphodiesterase class II)|nr:HD domain-containing phosphohydrolase [Pseudomonadales bacterium]MDP7146046.1 HD domain-containing phosphohydrolase [Pseudomonadales bacterium]MDP7359502.1 HD domain-containing phosphohydrolase [Pseudomonadales bacterium]MDP7595380.1 HD domain-containing phosphohydrolase [Pseudomonadales bacterium]HJN53016.1 HD domain-containing phosphohydrolase [Pseudomonadales bacterium]|tara:strand:- start:583 stop:2349 length:1767 start_codon:yes stop_codon:yes gene_type:complete
MTDQVKTSSLEKLIEIGLALSAERDIDNLMERILLEAKGMGNADGGTLYIRTEEDTLKFEIVRTDSLDFKMGGTTGNEITEDKFPPQQMYIDGQPNHKGVVSHAALTGETIRIDDAYETEEYDFSGAKKMDEGTGYRSTSFLAVPLKNHQDHVIGVLQLLNALDPDSGAIIPFSEEIQPLIEALASQAAVAFENQQLLEAQVRLLDSFIELMATAVDAKSHYTGGHCVRVPVLTEMLSEAACKETEGPFADYDLNEDQRYELHIAAWLHDCGKVTTPEYVVDKATRLETITDRIHEIRMRFEVVKREAVMEYQQALLDGRGEKEKLKQELDLKLAQLDDDFAFLAECNVAEFVPPEKTERVAEIARIEWTRTLDDRLGIAYEELRRKERFPQVQLPVREKLLADRQDHIVEQDSVVHGADPKNPYGFKLSVPEHKYNLGEVYNLCVQKGTLTNEERFKINDHIVQTIVMLQQLPFPKHLDKVPEIAGGHHEKMDGTGYPKGLDKSAMPIPARIMAIADIFEALTAADRPYKSPKTLSESIQIMSYMAKDAHIDDELFRLFLESGVYKQYAEEFLIDSQIDEVDIAKYV